MPERWRIAIDTGGTFTDAVALAPDGALRTTKVLSSGVLRAILDEQVGPRSLRLRQRWGAADGFVDGAELRAAGAWRIDRFEAAGSLVHLDRQVDALPQGAAIEIATGEDAPALAIRLLTRTPAGQAPPPCEVRLSTTRATNALLERRGARVGLVLPAGHADLLAIGDQRRADLFAITVAGRPLWHEATAEINCRLDSAGAEIVPVDPDDVQRAGAQLRAAGVDSVAIALLHADVNCAHEAEVERLLLDMGFAHISRSSALAARLGLLARAQTAAIDAYIGPVLRAYLQRAGRHASLRIMTSAGGLSTPDRFRATDGLLSGPAGGVAGALDAGRAEGEARIISFDMGGTSTDVARLDDGFSYRFEQRIEGATILAPALAIETVAAGGGSICALEHGRLSVGPRSAGADPGPACYGAGGPLTLTDVNLLLGRIEPSSLPIPIDAGAAELRLAELIAAIARETGASPRRDALLEGLIDIADERMAGAIRAVSSRQGVDPAEYAMVAFGGAGGLHACGVARRLGVRRIIIPARAGLLSAVGVGCAVVEEFSERQLLRPLADAIADMEIISAELADEASAALAPAPARVRRRLVSLRLAGQESTIDLEWPPGAPVATLADRFAREHERLYGVEIDRARIEIVSLRVIVEDPSSAWQIGVGPSGAAAPATPGRGKRHDETQTGAMKLWRDQLAPGRTVAGPALVLEPTATTWVAPGWNLMVSQRGALVLEAGAPQEAGAPAAARDDRVRQELFTSRLEAIAEDMGETLRRCALSTNIRQRLDFSCAILDARAELIISAPHVPVHLGALGECVRRVRERIEIGPADVIITNHPAYGGSHLPDVTLIAGVFVEDAGAAVAYIACRAHHAEIGGVAPGSMPAGATALRQEGVLIEPMRLVRAGAADWTGAQRLLEGAEHPTRAIEENLADLRAQLASVRRGVEAVRQVAAAAGSDVFARRAEAIKAGAERLLRRKLAELPPGPRSAERRMDDGSAIRVRIDLAERAAAGPAAVIDFAGTSAEHPGGLNATPAIVRSCIVYALRLLVDEPIPLNEGLMRAIDLRLPRGMLNPRFEPGREPAVAGGNVETSQAIADALIEAFGLAAGSQGTMNNLAFGPPPSAPGPSFYETLGGGAGATADGPGASAVHSHMTNTALTDPEVMERRFPVRIERMAIRRGSGGAGAHRGGDGVERRLRFLAPARLSLVTQRRVEGAHGAAGGGSAAPGAQWIERAGGRHALPSIAQADLAPGDALVVLTPGGGGWGAAPPEPRATLPSPP
ncbi:MAG: hydantoinase B/oxoprolinase family protein [Phycisphaerales bacterium JB039]